MSPGLISLILVQPDGVRTGVLPAKQPPLPAKSNPSGSSK